MSARKGVGNWSQVHERLNACLGGVYAHAVQTFAGAGGVPLAAFPNSDWYCALWKLPMAAMYAADLHASEQCSNPQKEGGPKRAASAREEALYAGATLWALPLLRWAKALGSESVYLVKYDKAVANHPEHRAAPEEWAGAGPLGNHSHLHNHDHNHESIVPPNYLLQKPGKEGSLDYKKSEEDLELERLRGISDSVVAAHLSTPYGVGVLRDSLWCPGKKER